MTTLETLQAAWPDVTWETTGTQRHPTHTGTLGDLVIRVQRGGWGALEATLRVLDDDGGSTILGTIRGVDAERLAAKVRRWCSLVTGVGIELEQLAMGAAHG